MASLADENGELPELSEWDQPISSSKDLENFHTHLAHTMADLNFYDPENPKQLLTRMRRLFNRVRMDEMEVSILRGLLSAVQRKIK
jgi:tRNA (cytidine32/uridine32-2'-O)-methyltransferase